MKAEEIREIRLNEYSDTDSANHVLLREIAAQLAEANERQTKLLELYERSVRIQEQQFEIATDPKKFAEKITAALSGMNGPATPAAPETPTNPDPRPRRHPHPRSDR